MRCVLLLLIIYVAFSEAFLNSFPSLQQRSFSSSSSSLLFFHESLPRRNVLKRGTFHSSSLRMMRGEIPSDLSASDPLSSSVLPSSELVPNIDIHPLDGGSFLGLLLWSYVLYNGLFGLAGRPADWLLPSLAKVLKEEEKEWFKDFSEGFSYFCPPPLELLRVALFLSLGFLVNSACIASFDGDDFWTWSIATCLAIPSALINLSRDPRLTRERSAFLSNLSDAFTSFANNKLEVDPTSKSFLSIYKIISAFRQDFRDYRKPEVLT